ncbi:TonB-dependent receptor [Persicobacter sp. CCB-QB2]|uniref:SusC/RagA family TonB-linked outer membrane protein n=1 Tax=Persicobacter sp. CCB-QB2 TaxID=1561025 RepID=UPI0009E61B9A|nr:TonB-dependent receptor [Persicobacter sp. CCB-QB2]
MKNPLLIALAILWTAMSAFAQGRVVTGTVTAEESGEPIPGVNVTVKGSATGTITDIEGKYSLNVDGAKSLVFSFIGLATEEVVIGNRSKVDMVMTADIKELEEVMVVAYGTAKRSSFTGSAATIKSEDIITRQSSDVTKALAGQLAGVQIQSQTGQPGETADIRVRGVGSISSSNQPLYVIDGIPFDGKLASVNPQDIESLTVLKDAASNALYGARGANGVVLITTKKGKKGKSNISFDAKVGVNRRAIPNYDVMTSPTQYYETFYKTLYNNEIYGNDNPNPVDAHQSALSRLFNYNNGGLGYQVYTVPDGQDFIGTDGKMNPNATVGYSDGDYFYRPDNWEDEIFDSGNRREEYNISVSGAANEKMNYYLSLGYLDDTGIAPGSGFTRYSGRLRSDYQAKDWLKLGANFHYTHYDQQAPRNQTSSNSSGNLFYVTNMMAPIYPLYVRDTDGNVMIDRNGFTVYDFGDVSSTNNRRPFMGQSNPASTMELDDRRYVSDVIGARGNAELSFTDYLRLNVNFGVDSDNQRYHYLYNGFYGQYAGQGGLINVYNYRRFGLTKQYLLNFNKTFGEHNIEALAGYEDYQYTYQFVGGSRGNLFDPTAPELGNGIENPQNDSKTDRYATQGFLSRVQYDYAGKYFGSLSYRRDASSRFHPDNRWGNFWSASFAWLITKEDFMIGSDFVDLLKFKASFGQQGNDRLLYQGYADTPNNINFYPYQDQYKLSNQGGDFALTLDYKGNPDITWETANSFNTGFDFGLFGNKLSGSLEYFSRTTTDMLYYMPVPPHEGYSFLPINVGSMRNSGLEIDLRSKLIENRNFSWAINVNATFMKNKILSLEESLDGEMIDDTRIYREGESMYQMYIRSYAGVDQETGKALFWKDIVDDETGEVTGRETTDSWDDGSFYATGDMLPVVSGGFGTQLNYKGFDFAMGFAYQLGGEVYDNTYAQLMHVGTSSDAGKNWHKDILNAWTPENRNTGVPRLKSGDVRVNSTSDRFMVSSNFLSLANITVGYTFPSAISDKLKLGDLRIYMVADNVALWSARQGLDPRQSFTSAGSYRYAPVRSVSGGLSVKF